MIPALLYAIQTVRTPFHGKIYSLSDLALTTINGEWNLYIMDTGVGSYTSQLNGFSLYLTKF